MSYIDGYMSPVKTARKDEYKKGADEMAGIFLEYGATRVVETWGDDVPDGKVTDMKMAVKAERDETVVYSWVEWPSKDARDAGMKKVMEDPRMKMEGDLSFDPKRMIFGGFTTIVDKKR